MNLSHLINKMNRRTTKPTKWRVCPAKTQFRLGGRTVWSESSLSAWRNFGSLAAHWAHIEDSDQTVRICRLIWVFAGHTCHSFGFVMSQLEWQKPETVVLEAVVARHSYQTAESWTQWIKYLRSSVFPYLQIKNIPWATSRVNLHSGCCDQARFKLACSASEAS